MDRLADLFRPLANRLGLPLDAVLHFAAGLVIGLAVLLLTGSPALSFYACLAAGVAKEAYDSERRGHTVELRDAVATTIPGAVIFALSLLSS